MQDPHTACLQQLDIEVDAGRAQQDWREIAGLLFGLVDIQSELAGAHADHQPHPRPRPHLPQRKVFVPDLQAIFHGAKRNGVAHDDLPDCVIVDDAQPNSSAGDEHFEVAGALRAGNVVDREVLPPHVQWLHRQLGVILRVVHEDAGLKQLERGEIHPHWLQLAAFAELLVAALDLL